MLQYDKARLKNSISEIIKRKLSFEKNVIKIILKLETERNKFIELKFNLLYNMPIKIRWFEQNANKAWLETAVREARMVKWG